MTEINEMIHEGLMRVIEKWNNSIRQVLEDILIGEGLTWEMLIIRAIPVGEGENLKRVYAAFYDKKELLRWEAPVILDRDDGKLTYQWTVYKVATPMPDALYINSEGDNK